MLVPRNSGFFQFSRQKLLYLHIPKCGGSYIQDMFRPYAKWCPTIKWPEAKGHLTYQQYDPIFRARAERLHDYLLITVVRNPWAWHVSWYNYIRRDKGGRKSGLPIEHETLKDLSFAEYLDWLDDDSAPRSPQGYLDKQLSDWIVDEFGRVQADIILRQESLYADVLNLVGKLNLKVRPVQKSVNVSTQDDFRTYYADDGIERIAKRHQRDIQLFQYTFDDG